MSYRKKKSSIFGKTSDLFFSQIFAFETVLFQYEVLGHLTNIYVCMEILWELENQILWSLQDCYKTSPMCNVD